MSERSQHQPRLDSGREALLRSAWAKLGGKPIGLAKMDLLGFWARHPGGWSSHGALAPWSRASRQDMNQAIEELVESGLITRTSGSNGRILYALDAHHQATEVLAQFSRLTPDEKRFIADLHADL